MPVSRESPKRGGSEIFTIHGRTAKSCRFLSVGGKQCFGAFDKQVLSIG